MKIRTLATMALILSMPLSAGTAAAHPSGSTDGSTVTTVFDRPVVTAPGKVLVAQEVVYPPGAGSVPHRHAGSAFIMAYVLSGTIRSQVAGEPERVFTAGQTWEELPGAHHIVGENASDTEPARLLAVFFMDADDTDALTTPDAGIGGNHE